MRKLYLIALAILAALCAYAFIPGVKPAVDTILTDTVITPTGSALGSYAQTVVTQPFWLQWIKPNYFTIGLALGAIIYGVASWKLRGLLKRKPKIPPAPAMGPPAPVPQYYAPPAQPQVTPTPQPAPAAQTNPAPEPTPAPTQESPKETEKAEEAK